MLALGTVIPTIRWRSSQPQLDAKGATLRNGFGDVLRCPLRAGISRRRQSGVGRQVPVCEQQSLSDRRSESFSRVARFELMSDGKDQHDIFGG